LKVGVSVGGAVGLVVGTWVICTVGSAEGIVVGADDGVMVGWKLGPTVAEQLFSSSPAVKPSLHSHLYVFCALHACSHVEYAPATHPFAMAWLLSEQRQYPDQSSSMVVVQS
jgi:hypothetical protein